MKRSQQQGTRRRGAGLWGRALPALLAAALACAACQPSPPGDILPQKDQQAMLEQAGFGPAQFFGELSFDPPGPESQRWMVAAQKK